MNVETAKRILDAQEQIDRELTAEYGLRQKRFLEVLEYLAENQKIKKMLC